MLIKRAVQKFSEFEQKTFKLKAVRIFPLSFVNQYIHAHRVDYKGGIRHEVN